MRKNTPIFSSLLPAFYLLSFLSLEACIRIASDSLLQAHVLPHFFLFGLLVSILGYISVYSIKKAFILSKYILMGCCVLLPLGSILLHQIRHPLFLWICSLTLQFIFGFFSHLFYDGSCPFLPSLHVPTFYGSLVLTLCFFLYLGELTRFSFIFLFSIFVVSLLFLALSPRILTQTPVSKPVSACSSEETHQKWFIQHYMLTPREAEVFLLLITTEENIQQMADSLYMSKRNFQRHITSIYEKAGVKSRMGLYQLYIQTKERKHEEN